MRQVGSGVTLTALTESRAPVANPLAWPGLIHRKATNVNFSEQGQAECALEHPSQRLGTAVFARLGDFSIRHGEGEPGWQILWPGDDRLRLTARRFDALKSCGESRDHDAPNELRFTVTWHIRDDSLSNRRRELETCQCKPAGLHGEDRPARIAKPRGARPAETLSTSGWRRRRKPSDCRGFPRGRRQHRCKDRCWRATTCDALRDESAGCSSA